jgi:hypothetical protein
VFLIWGDFHQRCKNADNSRTLTQPLTLVLRHYVWVRNNSLSFGDGWGEAILRHLINRLQLIAGTQLTVPRCFGEVPLTFNSLHKNALQ